MAGEHLIVSAGRRPDQTRVLKTQLLGVMIIQSELDFTDHRGSYRRLYHHEIYHKLGITVDFVEDDISISKYKVLRGLHGDYQTWKLVSCLQGEFFLVVVNNVREHWEGCQSLPSLDALGIPRPVRDCDCPLSQRLQWESFRMTSSGGRQVVVPPGFANGHLVLSERTIFCYKQSHSYAGQDKQFTLNPFDPALKIPWPLRDPILSKRDQRAPYIVRI